MVNVGLVREATINLTSFNIVMGPNNSGKSTLATTLYAAVKTVSAVHASVTNRVPNLGQTGYEAGLHISRRTLRSLAKEMNSKPSQKEWNNIIHRLVQHAAVGILRGYAQGFVKELEAGLGAPLSQIATRDPSGRRMPLRLRVESERPDWTIDIRVRGEETPLAVSLKSEIKLPRESFRQFYFLTERDDPIDEGDAFALATILGRDIVAQLLFASIPRAAHYLPAARAGLLQSHRLVAAAMIQASPMIGIGEVSMPALSGVVADFISEILLRPAHDPKKRAPRLVAFADQIQTEVLGGRVDQVTANNRYPEIEFENELGRYPIHRTSSMVSELAPIVLLLRSAVDEGDLLIVEEPESHLHPETQTALARILFALGDVVSVFVTTHSDYFVSQLNNEIRRKQLEAGYDDAPDFTSAYWVEKSPEGSKIKSLKVDGIDGIPEDSFTQVSLDLYNLQVSQQVSLVDGN